MQFSEHYDVTRGPDDDWFDPLLTRDTRLYVDPFRVYADPGPEWEGAHDHLIAFFTMVMGYVSEAAGETRHPAWGKAKSLLLFPEPAEFCLGTAETSVQGSGSSTGLRTAMLEGARTAVGLGIQDIEHMEMLVLFSEGIGVDRLSDMVCNVLKEYFVRYTQQVCRRHGVPTVRRRLRHSSWEGRFGRWQDDPVDLPENPYLDGGTVLLVPERFLRAMPTADASEFWDFAWANQGEQLRDDFNYDVSRKVPAALKARLARQNPALVTEYLRSLETDPKPPYDLQGDPQFRVQWYQGAKEIAAAAPLSQVPPSPAEVPAFVESVIASFAHGLEHAGLWRLLWNGATPRREKEVQRLFASTVLHYCRANHVVLSGESDAGRGPVDFKFAAGFTAQALVELKLTDNTDYWSGLQSQLVAYLRAEETHVGYFVSVGYWDKDFEPERMDRVRAVAARVSADVGRDVRVAFVDARKKPSASNLKSPAPKER